MTLLDALPTTTTGPEGPNRDVPGPGPRSPDSGAEVPPQGRARPDPVGTAAPSGRPDRSGAPSRKVANTARALTLVLLAGALFGISPVIGRISAGLGLPPLGIVLWSNALAALACMGWTCLRSGPPRLTRADLCFIVGWAIILGCLYQTLTILVAARVEATVIALVSSLRGFLVFLLAAALMLEAVSLRRFLGLGLGFAAVAGLLASDASAQGIPLHWLAACFALPALLAIHTVIMCSRRTNLGASAAVGAMMSVSCLLLLPFAIATDALVAPWDMPGAGVLLIAALGLCTALALVLAVILVRSAGPVFAGQMAYSQTIGGLMWSFVMLDERLSPLAWGALALLLAGVWIVAPRSSCDIQTSAGAPRPQPCLHR